MIRVGSVVNQMYEILAYKRVDAVTEIYLPLILHYIKGGILQNIAKIITHAIEQHCCMFQSYFHTLQNAQ